jgi:hypothetical protein
MFCRLEDLWNESDVEQKFLWHLLTSPPPRGLGYSPSEIASKPTIRPHEINKGSKRQVHVPDYIVLLHGLPVLLVEAKAPEGTVDGALEEARLYAAKLNEAFPAGVNPCVRVLATNGRTTASTSHDSAAVDVAVTFAEVNVADTRYAQLVAALGRDTLVEAVAKHLRTVGGRPLTRPVSKLGGKSVRNEEIGHNTFGSELALDFRHLFNPSTLEARAYLVRNAYVTSKRRERYVDPIDRLVRGIAPPAIAHLRGIDDTSESSEVAAQLRKMRALENQIMLLVGSPGSGKSTYVDYLVNVALPPDIISRTTWLRLDLNTAPHEEKLAIEWLLDRLTAELRDVVSEIDLEEFATLLKIYSPDVRALKKGVLSLFAEGSPEYNTRLADELRDLQRNKLGTARSLARYVCTDRGRLMVVVLDNCDKRNLEEQLLMFQLAHWMQSEFKCLVVLPVRDVTYDLHRHKPPLDTAQKDLVFRIEPPQFAQVLSARVALALRELASKPAEKRISYVLPNGFRVDYPASAQAMYLASILRSLYEHDRFLRRILSGLAGRNIRMAIELFLDFCRSGHIGEDEILKINHAEGNYALPIESVTRVLLRMDRRYYDGDRSHVKNLFQCSRSDAVPDHFVRIAILRLLESRLKEPGPSGANGFHSTESVVSTLILHGHEASRIRIELLYLLASQCILAEHQRVDELDDEDLISLAPGGAVHLEMLQSVDYLAACAEDTLLGDAEAAQRIASRISQGPNAHFSAVTRLTNAREMVDYLTSAADGALTNPASYLAGAPENLYDWRIAIEAVDRAEHEHPEPSEGVRIYVGNLPFDASRGEVGRFFEDRGFDVHDLYMPIDAGRNRGFAFVTLASQAAVREATERLSRERLAGRHLRFGLDARTSRGAMHRRRPGGQPGS